jgi:hypothetical protein
MCGSRSSFQLSSQVTYSTMAALLMSAPAQRGWIRDEADDLTPYAVDLVQRRGVRYVQDLDEDDITYLLSLVVERVRRVCSPDTRGVELPSYPTRDIPEYRSQRPVSSTVYVHGR